MTATDRQGNYFADLQSPLYAYPGLYFSSQTPVEKHDTYHEKGVREVPAPFVKSQRADVQKLVF